MREIDPDTQCEIIPKKRIATLMPNGSIMLKMLAMSAFCGFDLFPKPKLKQGKPEYYYIDLPKRFSNLPYEGKQEQRRLKWHLKEMSRLSEYENIVKYKFR